MTDVRKSGQFVVPGERIGVIEEFIPDNGTYVEDGVIYAKNAGCILIDSISRKVSVYPLTKGLAYPKIRSIVIGHVAGIQGSTAFIRVIKVGKRFLSGFFTCALHVSDVDIRYTDEISNAVKVSDLVRARITSYANGMFHLTTKGEKLGVVLALCSKCGETLILKNKRNRKLYCRNCRNVETRKIASDYGSGKI